MGINLGEVVIDGEDILGDGVNMAARLEGLAPPGGILASDLVQSQVNSRIGIIFIEAGEIKLKNIDRPLRVWCCGGEEAAASERPGAPSDLSGRTDKPALAVLPFTVMSNNRSSSPTASQRTS